MTDRPITVLIEGDEASDLAIRTTLAQFFADNADGIDADEQALIVEYLDNGHCYTGGGGAAPLWTVYTPETSQP